MLSIVENIGGKITLYNLHNLRLPEGHLAHTLDGSHLYRCLLALGVPDINPCQGVQDLCLQYARFLRAKEAET